MTSREKNALATIVSITVIAGAICGAVGTLFVLGQTRGSDINRLENVERIVPIVHQLRLDVLEVRTSTETKFEQIQDALERIEDKGK